MERKLFSKVIMTMTAAAVMGLASCSNENVPMGGDLTPQGEPTSMKLVLDLSGGAYSRAIQDDNATDVEKKIDNLNVYIYDANGIFEKEHILNLANDFEEGANNVWTTNKVLEATTGKKTIYVGANMTAGMKQIMKANSAQALAKKGVGATLTEITDNNGFVMFSTVAAGNTLKATAEDQPANIPADNQVKVTLQRLAAKIAVGMTANLADPGVKQGAAGEITDLGFLVDNINKMYYLTYGGVDGNTPAATTDANMFVRDYDKDNHFEFADWQNTPQFQTITPGTAEKATWKTAYAAENLTTDKVIEGVTRIVVKGQFTPKSGIMVDGTAGQRTFKETDGHIAKGANYYMFNLPEAGGYAFFKEADATDEILKEWLISIGITDTGKQNEAIAAKVLYTGGMNYWWITVDDNRGDIKRNNFYRADIKSIWAPGRNNGEFGADDKGDVVDEKTNITVQITVEPWNLKDFNADLRP